MTKIDWSGRAEFEKRAEISRLCALACINICRIADHHYHPVARAPLAREACVAVTKASKLLRDLAGRAAERPGFELSHCVFTVFACIESRLYPWGRKLHADAAEVFAAEWFLI